EVNVRTYVTRDGKPGLWFFSLDAASTLAVEAAKRIYKLPYTRAQMRYERDDFVHHESARAGAAFSGSYRGVGDLFQAEPGSASGSRRTVSASSPRLSTRGPISSPRC